MDFHQGVKRERWGGRQSMVVMSLAASCGIATVLRLPWVAAYHGSWFFYIYCAALVAFAWPMMLFELNLGQRRQRAAKDALSKVDAHAGGVGLATGWLALLATWAYSLVVVYLCVYSYEALFAPLPWTVDMSVAPDLLTEPVGLALSQQHFRGVISEESDGGFSLQVFFCVVGVWAVLYLLSFDGVIVSSSMAGWALILAFLAQMWLLVHSALTLPGWADGVGQLFVTDASNPFTAELVVDGITQALFAANIGNGALIAFGSFNDEGCDVVRHSLEILAAIFVASLFVCILTFGAYGALLAQVAPVEPAVSTIPELVRFYADSNDTAPGFLGTFNVYTYSSAALLSPPSSCLLALALFVPAGLLGLMSLHAWSLSLFGTLRDVLQNQRLSLLAAVVCGVGCLGTVPFAWGSIGHEMLDQMDRWYVRVALPLAAILEGHVAASKRRADGGNEARDMANEVPTGRQRVPYIWYYLMRGAPWLLMPVVVVGFGVCIAPAVTTHTVVAIVAALGYIIIVGAYAWLPSASDAQGKDMSQCWSDRYITQEKPTDAEVVLPNH